MLRKYLFGAALLAASLSQAWAGEAGRIVFVTGRADLGGQPAKLDAVISEGQEMSTGADGYIYVKTLDDGFLILRPNSRVRVSDYKFDPARPSATKVKLELLNGVARAISGSGVKQARQNFRFNTPVAAIGVRGTDFIVYTDQQTSRVSVVSGGVVMSPFSGGCTADGVGPCEGQASRELFAGQAGMLLQVQRGQTTPQLLNNPALSPDQSEKPRADEPVGKVAVSGSIQGTQVNLDPQKSALSLDAVHPLTDNGTPVTPTDQNPPVLPPVVAPPVTQVMPKAQEVFWGRWTTVAGAAVMPDSIKNNATDAPAFVGNYAVARLKGAQLVMPTEGTVAFALAGGEAYVQKSGGADALATVESGRLAINFVDRSFTTGLVVASDSAKYNVNGAGVVDMHGQLSNIISSPTTIRGFLSGANVEEAAYVFKNASYPSTTITGATSWKR
jgi:hypothetical protein